MDFRQSHTNLVADLESKGIRNPAVLKAMNAIPRHLFVSEEWQHYAYEDTALPIHCQQTISQPFVVARMTEALLSGGVLNKVLEIGTGSGYQAAILSQLAKEVYTVERIKTLLDEATKRFKQLGLTNIYPRHGDGYLGWSEHAPYDGILVTAAASEIPAALLEQLAEGGHMIIPVNTFYYGQELQLIVRKKNEFEKYAMDLVAFVPLLKGTLP
ncbi:MAG: protein-L-isoaspartate(D-aspartate) O-methyltransferase [Gammaproteobacteria bacterium]